MRSQEFTLPNASGLHARPAAVLVRAAAELESRVRVLNLDRPGSEADGKSILGVLALGAGCGARVRIEIEGVDEGPGLQALGALIRSGLGDRVPQAGQGAGGGAGAECGRGRPPATR